MSDLTIACQLCCEKVYRMDAVQIDGAVQSLQVAKLLEWKTDLNTQHMIHWMLSDVVA